MLLERSYNDLGIQALLEATGTPKGSFYHHFASKEDFALTGHRPVHARRPCRPRRLLGDAALPRSNGCGASSKRRNRATGRRATWACLLGGLGQELSGVSEVFRRKIEKCFAAIAARLAVCLEEARKRATSARYRREAACRAAGRLLGGAALRSGCGGRRTARAMLDFMFRPVTARTRASRSSSRGRGRRTAGSFRFPSRLAEEEWTRSPARGDPQRGGARLRHRRDQRVVSLVRSHPRRAEKPRSGVDRGVEHVDGHQTGAARPPDRRRCRRYRRPDVGLVNGRRRHEAHEREPLFGRR